jgi:hypothetical protein
MTDITVYKCGNEVKIKKIDLNGFITGINIRDNRIMYEVSYFMNNTYCAHWFCEYELLFSVSNETMTIGFK